MTTIVGLLRDDIQVTGVRDELQKMLLVNEAVSVLHQPAAVWQRLGGHEHAHIAYKSTGLGMLIGATVYGVLGYLAGFGCVLAASTCSRPVGITTFILSILIGALHGAIFGRIVGLNELEESLRDYMEGSIHGDAVLVIEVPDGLSDRVLQILQGKNGRAIRQLGGKARVTGAG